MNILRRFFISLFGFGLLLALMATAWSHVGITTIGNRNTVKSWLVDSGFYDNVVDFALESINEEQAAEGETTIPTNSPEVQAVFKDALSSSFLQENIEGVLDGTYSWLEGKTPKPEFVVDLSTVKQKIADGLSSYAVSHAASLPACTPDQMAAMSAEGFDVLNATCLPPGVNVQAVAAELKNDVLTSEQFLKDTSLTGDDIGLSSCDVKQTSDCDNDKTTVNEYLNSTKIQTAYKLASYGPYIFGVLALLLSVGVFFLSSTKRRGLRRVGIVFTIAGVLLGISYIGYTQSSSWLNRRAQELSGETNAGRDLAAGLVNSIGKDITSILLWYAIGFTLIGVAGIVFTALYKRGDEPKSPSSSEPKPPVDDSPKEEPAKKPESTTEKPEPKKPSKPPTKIQL